MHWHVRDFWTRTSLITSTSLSKHHSKHSSSLSTFSPEATTTVTEYFASTVQTVVTIDPSASSFISIGYIADPPPSSTPASVLSSTSTGSSQTNTSTSASPCTSTSTFTTTSTFTSTSASTSTVSDPSTFPSFTSIGFTTYTSPSSISVSVLPIISSASGTESFQSSTSSDPTIGNSTSSNTATSKTIACQSCTSTTTMSTIISTITLSSTIFAALTRASPEQASSIPIAIGGLPSCSANVIFSMLGNTSCSVGDITCMCSAFTSLDAAKSVSDTCPGEVSSYNNFATSACGAVTTSTSVTVTSTATLEVVLTPLPGAGGVSIGSGSAAVAASEAAVVGASIAAVVRASRSASGAAASAASGAAAVGISQAATPTNSALVAESNAAAAGLIANASGPFANNTIVAPSTVETVLLPAGTSQTNAPSGTASGSGGAASGGSGEGSESSPTQPESPAFAGAAVSEYYSNGKMATFAGFMGVMWFAFAQL